MSDLQVAPVSALDLRASLRLLEEWLRHGEPVPEGFVEKIQQLVEGGDLEVLAARIGNRTVGVLVLAFRTNVSLGATFASVEDLLVVPEARRKGCGRAMLQAAHERCTSRGISYLEVQVEENEAADFYAAFGYEPEPGVRVFSRSLPIGRHPDEGLPAER